MNRYLSVTLLLAFLISSGCYTSWTAHYIPYDEQHPITTNYTYWDYDIKETETIEISQKGLTVKVIKGIEYRNGIQTTVKYINNTHNPINIPVDHFKVISGKSRQTSPHKFSLLSRYVPYVTSKRPTSRIATYLGEPNEPTSFIVPANDSLEYIKAFSRLSCIPCRKLKEKLKTVDAQLVFKDIELQGASFSIDTIQLHPIPSTPFWF